MTGVEVVFAQPTARNNKQRKQGALGLTRLTPTTAIPG